MNDELWTSFYACWNVVECAVIYHVFDEVLDDAPGEAVVLCDP